MALSKRDSAVIQAHLGSNVQKTFVRMDRFIKRRFWLGQNNSYIRDTVQKVNAEVKKGGIKNGSHLSQYVAASCLLHCADGWSYLGRALYALLRGDPHRSRHLGYYAELRATMSLLASQGIGVLNKYHVIIDGPRSVVPLRGEYATHQFAWDCLYAWSAQPQSGALFSRLIKPGGRSLDDWFSLIGAGNAIAPPAEQWFRQWGMDLKFGLADRSARNESSYRPDGVPNLWDIEAKEALDLAQGIWSVLEPTAESRFDAMDKYILRVAIESFFRGTTGSSAGRSPKKFRSLAESIIQHQELSTESQAWWFNFLTRKVSASDPLIFALSRQMPGFQGASYAGILARATLLLRVASGAAAELLNSAGVDAEATKFWWNKLGVARGLWEGAKEANDLLDLWSDVDVFLQELEKFRQKYSSQEQSFLRVGTELGGAAIGFGSLERVAIWSMTASR